MCGEALFMYFTYVAVKIEPKLPFNLIFKETEGQYAIWVLNNILSFIYDEQNLFKTQNAYRPSFSLKIRLNSNFGSIFAAM